MSQMIGVLAAGWRQQTPSCLVDVGGVGTSSKRRCPRSTDCLRWAPRSTYHHLVAREDANIFVRVRERARARLFRELLKVSNVGPKLALALLSGMNGRQLHRCIEAQDVERWCALPGVGRQNAERWSSQMRDRHQGLRTIPGVVSSVGGVQVEHASVRRRAFRRLISLGYKPPEVMRLLKSVGHPSNDRESLSSAAAAARSEALEFDVNRAAHSIEHTV